MKLFLATYYVFLLSSNASVVSSTSIRGAGLKKEQEMHENHEKQESLSESVSTPPEQGKDERSLLFGKEEEDPSNITPNEATFGTNPNKDKPGVATKNLGSPSTAAQGKGNANGKDNNNDKGKNDEDSMPEFLLGNELPTGLVNNPSQAVGVDLKSGKVPRAQKMPDLTQKKATIRGLDNKPIKLDLETSERINVYHPDRYSVSSDGTYVTENETGEVIKLTVFHASDHKDEFSVLYSLNEDGELTDVRVTPKEASEDGPGLKDDMEMEMNKKGKIQNFQRLDSTDILVGYLDEDLDLSNAPLLGDIATPDEDTEMEGDGGNRRHRRTQATSTQTRFGKTCNTWDWLDVRIVTDKKFKDRYFYHQLRAQAVFAEAAEIYWKESCVWLWMWSYENTVVNSNWITPNGQHIDTRLAGVSLGWWYSSVSAGCEESDDISRDGALQLLADTVNARQPSAYRDFWHLFSGASFSGNEIGCAYNKADVNACKSNTWGYGVNEITFSTSLRLQAVLFAHELGHNLGLTHYDRTPGYWVMEPSISTAPFDFNYTNANHVREKVVESSGCGWH